MLYVHWDTFRPLFSFSLLDLHFSSQLFSSRVYFPKAFCNTLWLHVGARKAAEHNKTEL